MRPINGVLRTIMRAVIAREGYAEPFGGSPLVNVIFHVEGEIRHNDFEGIRTSSFLKKKNIQMIQVAIPKEKTLVVDRDFVFSNLRAAVRLGAAEFKKRGIDYPLDSALELVERVKDDIEADHG